MHNLKNKIALVTGASYGIGKAIAIRLAREGCNLILVSRDQKKLNETKKRILKESPKSKILVIPCDLSKGSDINKMVEIIKEEFSNIDILWNGAFGWIEGKFEELSIDNLNYFIDSSIRGTILLTHSVMKLILKSNNPHIINVSADWEFPENEGISTFIAAKKAIASFGIALQKEYQGIIKVTNIHPADVASIDYDLDDSIEKILSETNNSQIPLSDLVELIVLILKLKGTIVHQINIKPLIQDINQSYF
jgi:3-oxoacyl-[acyl-carrier protein] reductase